MPDVVVIRPGCTEFDEQSRIQGTLDLPLSERGIEQVARLVEQLRPLTLESIYHSSCEPARSTAERIGQELAIPVRELEGLGNLNQGLWQGLPVDDVRRKFPKVFRQWCEQPETICPPEGETASDALERIRKALHKPLKKRGMIGLVVPEPLATLICCELRGERLLIPDPPGGGVRPPSIAILKDRDESGNGHWTETPLVPIIDAACSQAAGNGSSAAHGLPLSQGNLP